MELQGDQIKNSKKWIQNQNFDKQIWRISSIFSEVLL